MKKEVRRFLYLLLSFLFLATTVLGFAGPAAAGTPGTLSGLQPGDTVSFAGYTWVVLDPTNGYLLMQNGYANAEFDSDDTNTFDPTDADNVAYYLNHTFYNSLLSMDCPLIQTHEWTTGDENHDQDSTPAVYCKIGLISYSEYNNDKGSISNIPGWWWTRTPCSGTSNEVWTVFSNGSVGPEYANSGSVTVRPALYLDPDILVSGGASPYTVTDTTPPTPTISPDGGTSLTAPQNVSISNIAVGDKAYYTTNGTDPKSVSNAVYYKGTFTVDQTETVKAAVYDDTAGVWSGESSDTFNFFLNNTAVTDHTASFSFTAPTGATSVVLEQSADGGTTWSNSTTGTLSATSTSATATGLTATSAYEFKLVVTGGTYDGDSNVVDVTTTGPINDLTNTAVTGTTASFSFTAPAGATSVVLEQSTDSGASWAPAATGALSATSTLATATGLTAGTAYEFKLVVTGGTYDGDSNVVDVTTTTPISDLKNTAVTDTTASFSFTAPAGATSVVLEQSTDNGASWTNAATGTLSATSISATATGLTASTAYEFKLVVTGGSYAGDSNVVDLTTAGTTFSGGSGTKDDPYRIADAQDLNGIHSVETKPYYYELTQDVNLSVYGSTYSNETSSGKPVTGWDPIGDGMNNNNYFEGHFDGGGHTISNLYISDSAGNLDNAGLFGLIDTGATVTGVNLKDTEISGANSNSDDGALAGRNSGTVSGCSAAGGSVSGYNVGGLVGWNDAGSITDSYATGSVTNSVTGSYSGGLVGYNDGDSGTAGISDCYATGSVTGSGFSFSGGLVGENDGDSGTAGISDCYATGSVTGGGSYNGGLAGYNTGDGGTVTMDSSYWDTQTTGQSAATGTGSDTSNSDGNGETTAAMQQEATFAGWNFTGTNATWGINENISYPYLNGVPPTPLPTVSVSANPSAGGTVYGDGTYNVGDQATVTATPNSGYTFVNWTEGGTQVSTDASYTFTMGTSDVSLTANFTATSTIPAPTVTGVSPSSGPAAGGTAVTITGSGFTSGASVNFGTAAATGVMVNGGSSITATSPAGTGTVDVTVTTVGGTSATIPGDRFTYTSAGNGGEGSPPSLAVTTTALAAGTVGQQYNQTITTNGEGTAPYTFAVTGGSLPPGLALDASTGVISGTPTAAGTYTFTVIVKDANNNSASESYKVTVSPPGSATESVTLTPSAGGTVSLGSDVTLTIPAGALQGGADVNVTVRSVTSPPPAPQGYTITGAYGFTANGQDHYSFNRPVTMTFTFDPSKVPQGTTPAVYYYDGTKWILLTGTVDWTNDTISVTVDHWTNYAVMVRATTPLKDIAGNWAQASIEKLVSIGAVSGYPDGTFRPDRDITRAEFVTVLVKALNTRTHLRWVPGGYPARKAGPVFADIKGDWAQSYISTAAAYGIVSGYDASHFGPNDLITREQMTAIMARAAMLAPESGELTFTDAARIDAWARGDVVTAVKQGIVSGYPDGTFRPMAHATRAEAVAVVANILQ